MPLTFTQVPTVAKGDKVKASQLAALAQSIEDHGLSGLGSMTWRICFYAHAIARSLIRGKPDLEAWTQHFNREPGDDAWAVGAVGEEDGPNGANPINALVNGVSIGALDIASERVRLGAIPVPAYGVDLSPKDLFELGLEQAGVYDGTTGEFVSPLYTATTAYSLIRTSPYSAFDNGFGGYLARPVDLHDCEAPPEGEPYRSDLQIFFTKLTAPDAGTVITFPGTCPEVPDHIAGISYAPTDYIVYLNNGTVYVLPKAQWIEGPYTGNATLGKTAGDHFARGNAQFAADFRGTLEQRGPALTKLKNAFRLTRFMKLQYPLAPRLGQTVEDTIVPIRPKWSASGGGTIADGTALDCALGGTVYDWPAGSVCHQVMAHADGLAAPAVLRLQQGTGAVVALTLTPDETGHAEA
ncbi:MAG TPA: hypothetical protein VMB21_17615, partial [Candidatus Limnocylindria bacterium]|nr:hypothetical protein [Candidatus Limnocylindria bacterium]